jgi:hypothetical protein
MKTFFKKTFLVFLVITTAHSWADTAQYNMIASNQTTPQQIYQIIDAVKITTFAVDSFIPKPIPAEELNKWVSLITDANNFVINQVKNGKAPQKYVDTIGQLFTILNFCQKTANQLNTQKNNLSLAQINQLIAQAESFYKETRKLGDDILSQLPYPKSWISTVPSDPKLIVIKLDPAKPGEKIFVPKQLTYEEFFKDVKDINAVKNLTPEGFKRLLYLKYIDNKYTIANALDSFEKLAYRLTELSKNRGWFDWKDYSKDIEYSKVFAQKIKEAFPLSGSKLDTLRFLEITDKSKMIIFAQASTYEGVLTRIIKDLNSLKPKTAQ